MVSKLDDQLIAKVVELRKQKMTQEAIAVELRVSQGTVSRILRKLNLGGPLVKLRRRAKKELLQCQ